MTSEEVTAKRRAERKQFKVDRARAIAQAAAEAEAAFREGRIVSLEETKANIPSAATWKPSSSPIASASVSSTDPATNSTVITSSTSNVTTVPTDGDVTASTAEDATNMGASAKPREDGHGGAEGLYDEDEGPLEDVEHLQLTLPEAFFLCWALDCLTVLDPKSVCFLSRHPSVLLMSRPFRPSVPSRPILSRRPIYPSIHLCIYTMIRLHMPCACADRRARGDPA